MFRFKNELILRLILQIATLLSSGIVLFILLFLVLESLPALQEIGLLRFFSDPSWNPSLGAKNGNYNLTPMLLGSVLVMLGAIFLATPIGIGSALFCHYYAPSFLVAPYRRLVEILAGIPSVVYGLWGLVVLVPYIQVLKPPGASLLAGIFILTLMILPTIALLAEASFAQISSHQLRGGIALGLSRFGLLRCVIFPSAKSGLLTAVLLGAGRAIGETMAILMVCGNVVQIPKSFFDPIRTLTANMALEMAYASGTHRSALFVSGLFLFGIVFFLMGCSQAIQRRKR